MKSGPKPKVRPKTQPIERPVSEVPEPPEWLAENEVALDLWETTWSWGVTSKRLFPSSMPLVTAYCLCFARLVAAERTLATAEAVTPRISRTGEISGAVLHPAYIVLRDCQSELRSLSRSLSIRPGDVAGEEREAEKPQFSVEGFIAKIPGRTAS